MKPGFKTSEFWILLFVLILTNVQASGLVEPTHWAMKVAAVVVNVLGLLGYTSQRAKLKVAALGNSTPEDLTTKTVLP